MLKHNTFSLPFLVLKAEGMGPVIKSLNENLPENVGPRRLRKIRIGLRKNTKEV
jgi:hypothetical protein